MAEILNRTYNLLDSIPTTFLLTDFHSRILYANRQAQTFFGFPREELEGQRVRILFLEEDLIYFLPNIIYLTRYKDGFDGEILLRRKDGKKIFVHLFTASFKERGEVFLTFAIQEIQRMKNLERERREVERWASLGKMIQEITPQFRDPIASIRGYTSRLKKRPPGGSARDLERISKKVERLGTILERLEEFAQVPRPVFQKEKIEEVVDAAVSAVSKAAVGKGVTIYIDTADLEGDGQVFLDRGLMIKALSQILKNSVEAVQLKQRGRQKGAVEVSLLDDGETVGVWVSDRGQGIAKKNLSLIFEPFFATHPDRVGLGLTFVKRVIEEHGGGIDVESRAGRGTSVHLHLPKDRRRKVRREWISPEAARRGEETL